MTGEDIKRMRIEMGLEQATLAYIIGCRQKDISRWERERVKPGRKYRERITHLHQHFDDPMYTERIADAILNS